MPVEVERTTSTCASKAACEADCTAAKPGACAELARRLGPLVTDAATAKRAVELLEASCRLGDAKACNDLADDLSAGIVKHDPARATELWAAAAKAFRSACTHGDHVACRDAEDLYRKGRGVPRDESTYKSLHAQAVAIYVKACPAGDLDACEELASEYHFDESDPGNEAKAEALRQKLCAAGRPDACMTLARQLPDGKPRDALEEQARTLRRRKCLDEKDGGECFVLGAELEGELLQPQFRKPAEALTFFRAGCDLHEHAACLYASSILARTGKTDEARALQTRYLQMVEGLCDLPMPVACANLADLYRRGDRLPKDPEKAKSLARKACDGGLKTECARE